MALIEKQRYDPAEIQRLAELVRIYRERGQPFDYEISVDNLKVVRRTNDPEMFFLFENFVGPNSKAIEIVFFNGNSNANEKRMFTFSEDEDEVKPLNGVEVDARIQEQVEKHKRDWEHEQLKEKCKTLESEVADLESEVDKLEKANEALINGQSPFKGVLGEVGSSLIESFLKRNPAILKGIPGGEALAGLLQTDGLAANEDHKDVEVSFKAKGGSSLKDEEQAAVTFVNQLKSEFSKDEFDKVLQIIQTLANDKAKIDLILNHINIKHAQ